MDVVELAWDSWGCRGVGQVELWPMLSAFRSYYCVLATIRVRGIPESRSASGSERGRGSRWTGRRRRRRDDRVVRGRRRPGWKRLDRWVVRSRGRPGWKRLDDRVVRRRGRPGRRLPRRIVGDQGRVVPSLTTRTGGSWRRGRRSLSRNQTGKTNQGANRHDVYSSCFHGLKFVAGRLAEAPLANV